MLKNRSDKEKDNISIKNREQGRLNVNSKLRDVAHAVYEGLYAAQRKISLLLLFYNVLNLCCVSADYNYDGAI